MSQSPRRLRGSRPGGRLVEEQHRRAGDERGREVEPAAHAAGVGLGRPVAGVLELEALEQLSRAGARRPLAQVVEAPDHLEVLEAGEVLVDRGVLAGEPDARAQRRRLLDDVEARDARAARVGLEQRGEDAHGGRLAGAVGAEQAEDGALARLQVDPVERDDVPVRLGEALSDDGWFGHRPSNVLVASADMSGEALLDWYGRSGDRCRGGRLATRGRSSSPR